MSHAIDLDGLHEKLFVLQQIALASRSYCEIQEITPDSLEDGMPFTDAWGWTKALVSNYCIECAIKLRMIQEFCEKKSQRAEIRRLEKEAMARKPLGKVLIHADWKRDP